MAEAVVAESFLKENRDVVFVDGANGAGVFITSLDEFDEAVR